MKLWCYVKCCYIRLSMYGARWWNTSSFIYPNSVLVVVNVIRLVIDWRINIGIPLYFCVVNIIVNDDPFGVNKCLLFQNNCFNSGLFSCFLIYDTISSNISNTFAL